MSVESLLDALRDVKDFPKPGIVFKDITPVLADPDLLKLAVNVMSRQYEDNPPDKIVGIDARGFIFGAAMALKFDCGFVPVRKKGKLPWQTAAVSYELEYGSATLEIHQDALLKDEKVVIVDDLLATGGTAAAAVELVNSLGASIIGVQFFVELVFLNGKEKINACPVHSVLKI